MTKVAKYFAIAGGVIPVILMITKFIELAINQNAVPYSSLYGFYLWPASILLLGSHSEWDLRGIIWLAISIIANSLLYMLAGMSLASSTSVFKKLRIFKG
jgi:hypothetical protein